METLLEHAAKELPGLIVLVVLVRYFIAALAKQNELLNGIQQRSEAQQDKGWDAIAKLQDGCSLRHTKLEEVLRGTTDALNGVQTELRFFRTGNPERGGAS